MTKINIVKPFLPMMSEVHLEIESVLRSGLVTNNSEYVRKFESELQKYYSSKISPTVYCNGELALFHLIQAWKIKMGYSVHDSFDVLVPSFTFSGTINAIVLNNLKPIFCDVDETLTIALDYSKKPTANVKMIIAVGVYGNLPNIEALGNYAALHNLVLIFDNAPAFGSKYKNRFPCEFGFSEMQSFHATKIFNSMEGGANIVNDSEIAELLIHLRDFGQYEKKRGDIDVPGLNSKMQEISAIIGLKNLEKIDFILNSRAKNINQYIDHLSQMAKNGKFELMKVESNVTCQYLYFPIILHEDATQFVDYMASLNIAVRRYYTATHNLKYYHDKYERQNLSFTDSIKDRIVALPIHTIMDEQELSHMFTSVQNYYKGIK